MSGIYFPSVQFSNERAKIILYIAVVNGYIKAFIEGYLNGTLNSHISFVRNVHDLQFIFISPITFNLRHLYSQPLTLKRLSGEVAEEIV